MKILGDNIWSVDAGGKLSSRVGTLFLRTPGLVTVRTVHAMQRLAWLDEINRERAQNSLPPLSPQEEEDEISQSVDLIFTDEFVLIRPDPDRMDLALRADEELQKLVSKRRIRYLNTHLAKVRDALRSRGENWRMARAPESQEDMRRQILSSRVAASADGERLYYYNHATGTRYLTCADAERTSNPASIAETISLLSRRNRIGRPELDLFPVSTPQSVKRAFLALGTDAATADEAALKQAFAAACCLWRDSLPPALREESIDNFEWRNEMSQTLSSAPNEPNTDERELIQGISPEFYRQIEWLPGARMDRGQIIFDSVWDEFLRTRDPELAEICEERVRNILFNLSRLFSQVEYCNIGRISHSLARRPMHGANRGSVYIIQVKPSRRPIASVYMIRFQKWGIAEHLDEGKDLLRSIIEANEYSDYILDRRLMCQQLGMDLPETMAFGQISEPYRSANEYNGTTVRAYYFIRPYVHGTASDKISPARFANAVFAEKFASLMGAAAALDLIVGRSSTESHENLFDKFYEVVQFSADGMPVRVKITDHAGSFVDYTQPFEELVAPYADVVRRRRAFVQDYGAFADAFVSAFEKRMNEVRDDYRRRRTAFDELFSHRPFDTAGSGAYRWAKTLERLDACDPAALAATLRGIIRQQ